MITINNVKNYTRVAGKAIKTAVRKPFLPIFIAGITTSQVFVMKTIHQDRVEISCAGKLHKLLPKKQYNQLDGMVYKRQIKWSKALELVEKGAKRL
jgi:hypothetical protein